MCLVIEKVWESWKKKIKFSFFFTMKPSRLKITEKVLIFFFYGSAYCDSVWFPRKCGKVEKKINFLIFPTNPGRTQDTKSVQFFYL